MVVNTDGVMEDQYGGTRKENKHPISFCTLVLIGQKLVIVYEQHRIKGLDSRLIEIGGLVAIKDVSASETNSLKQVRI